MTASAVEYNDRAGENFDKVGSKKARLVKEGSIEHNVDFTPDQLTCAFHDVLWWGQLATSPLWARELSFEYLLEIASTRIVILTVTQDW